MPDNVPRFDMFDRFMNFKFHMKLFCHERCCRCCYNICCRARKSSDDDDLLDEDADDTNVEAQVHDLLIENIDHVMANFNYNTSVKHFIDVDLRVQANSKWRERFLSSGNHLHKLLTRHRTESALNVT